MPSGRPCRGPSHGARAPVVDLLAQMPALSAGRMTGATRRCRSVARSPTRSISGGRLEADRRADRSRRGPAWTTTPAECGPFLDGRKVRHLAALRGPAGGPGGSRGAGRFEPDDPVADQAPRGSTAAAQCRPPAPGSTGRVACGGPDRRGGRCRDPAQRSFARCTGSAWGTATEASTLANRCRYRIPLIPLSASATPRHHGRAAPRDGRRSGARGAAASASR